MAEVENVTHDPFKVTEEIKVCVVSSPLIEQYIFYWFEVVQTFHFGVDSFLITKRIASLIKTDLY